MPNWEGTIQYARGQGSCPEGPAPVGGKDRAPMHLGQEQDPGRQSSSSDPGEVGTALGRPWVLVGSKLRMARGVGDKGKLFSPMRTAR